MYPQNQSIASNSHCLIRHKKEQLTLNHHGRINILNSPSPYFSYHPEPFVFPVNIEMQKKNHEIILPFLILLRVRRPLTIGTIMKSKFYVPCSPSRNQCFSRFHSSLLREMMNMVMGTDAATFLDHSSLIFSGKILLPPQMCAN